MSLVGLLFALLGTAAFAHPGHGAPPGHVHGDQDMDDHKDPDHDGQWGHHHDHHGWHHHHHDHGDWKAWKKQGKADWDNKMEDHHKMQQRMNAAARRDGPDNKPIVCPFLAKIVPKAQGWENRAEDFARMLDAKDAAGAANVFAEDASLTMHFSGPHGPGRHDPEPHTAALSRMMKDFKAPEKKEIKGQASIKEHLDQWLTKTTDVRMKNMYSDFARETALVHFETFMRCPHTGQLHSKESVMEVTSIVDGKVAAASIYVSGWHSKQSATHLAEQEGSNAKMVSEVLGTVLGNRDCSGLINALGDEAELLIADKYYHKNVESADPYDLTDEVTSLQGKEKIAAFCKSHVEEHQKFAPLEFLEVDRAFEGQDDGSTLLLGSIAMKVVFSPKITDWAGAAKVKVCPKSGKIVHIALYPNEITKMVEKWAWKYGEEDGKPCAITKMQRITKRAISLGHQHPYALGSAVLGMLLALLVPCLLCCCKACGCRLPKRKVAVRELEAPLREMETVAAQEPVAVAMA